MHMMDGGPWMMGGMALIWILVVLMLVLGIASLVKYLRSYTSRQHGH